jgi:hypothetical protein
MCASKSESHSDVTRPLVPEFGLALDLAIEPATRATCRNQILVTHPWASPICRFVYSMD